MFQIAASFLTFILQKVVYSDMFKVWWDIYKTILLQIYKRVCQRKNFENRLIFGEVIGKSLVSCFWTYGVTNNADNKITHHTSTQQQ